MSLETDTSQFCPQVIDPSVCLTEKIEEKILPIYILGSTSHRGN